VENRRTGGKIRNRGIKELDDWRGDTLKRIRARTCPHWVRMRNEWTPAELTASRAARSLRNDVELDAVHERVVVDRPRVRGAPTKLENGTISIESISMRTAAVAY